MSDATITSKGQITIPVDIRRKLGLQTGDKISFVEDADGNILLRTKKYSLDDIMNLLPRATRKVTIEEMEQAIRKGWAGQIKS